MGEWQVQDGVLWRDLGPWWVTAGFLDDGISTDHWHLLVACVRGAVTMRKPVLFLALTMLCAGLLAGPAAAQSDTGDEGVLLRINGDVTVAEGVVHGLVVVIDGNLDFDGTADTIVVINGDAVLTGATVDELVVVSGTADLGPGTVITGDVNLVDTTLTRDPTATVEGTIDRSAGDGLALGFWLLGLLFMIGWAILVLLSGLVLAGVAPDLARRAGRTITTDLGPTILGGLVLWIVAPILGALLFASIIGVPIAITIWFVVLPVLGLVGFLVAGVRTGEYITARGGGTGHPYLASFVGLLVLIVVGAVPVIGPLVVAIAGFLGSGALAVHGYRAIRGEPRPPAPAPAVVTEAEVPAPASEASASASEAPIPPQVPSPPPPPPD